MNRIRVLFVCVLLATACTGASSGDGAVLASTSSSAQSSPETTISSTSGTIPTATTAVSTTTGPPTLGLEQPVSIVNRDGVFQISIDGTIRQLVTGPVAYAVDDTQGGLLFQMERGRKVFAGFEGEPPSGRPTIIWWIPAGASDPQELLVPTPGAVQYLSLHDSLAAGESFAVIYERHEGTVPFDSDHGRTADMADTLRVFDVASGSVAELYSVRGYEWNLADVTAGGGLVSATEVQHGGAGCRLFDAATGEPATSPGFPSATPACFDEFTSCATSCALTADADLVAYDWVRSEDGGAGWEIAVADLVVGTETARFSVSGETWSPAELDIHGDLVILNRTRDGLYEEPALVGDTSDPSPVLTPLPIAGRARFITHALDIPAPVVAPGDAASGSDAVTTIPTTPTTSVLPLVELRADGVGDLDFGEPTDVAMEALVDLLGSPDPGEEYPHGGHPLRFVYWDNEGLAVVFSDYEFYRSDGVEHLAGWTHSRYMGDRDARDEGSASVTLATAVGISLGFTLADLQSAYGDQVVLDAGCDSGGPPTSAYVRLIDRNDGRSSAISFGFEIEDLPLSAESRIANLTAGAGPGC